MRLGKGFKQTFAILSVFFLLHAITPGVFFGLSLIDGDSKAISQNTDPIAEEEDEHSDAKVKFLAPGSGAPLPVLTVDFAKPAETPLSAFIEEIPTPPPLR
jgi:hypothetical protein